MQGELCQFYTTLIHLNEPMLIEATLSTARKYVAKLSCSIETRPRMLRQTHLEFLGSANVSFITFRVIWCRCYGFWGGNVDLIAPAVIQCRCDDFSVSQGRRYDPWDQSVLMPEVSAVSQYRPCAPWGLSVPLQCLRGQPTSIMWPLDASSHRNGSLLLAGTVTHVLLASGMR